VVDYGDVMLSLTSDRTFLQLAVLYIHLYFGPAVVSRSTGVED